MTARSKGHHEIPKWLLKHFCWDKGKTLWMGSKDTREVKAVVLSPNPPKDVLGDSP